MSVTQRHRERHPKAAGQVGRVTLVTLVTLISPDYLVEFSGHQDSPVRVSVRYRVPP